MRFEWDPRKAAANRRKHGIGFRDAITVFFDANARIFADPDHSEGELRELIVGYDSSGRLLIVSFVEREGNIRIVSARRATTRERHNHEEN